MKKLPFLLFALFHLSQTFAQDSRGYSWFEGFGGYSSSEIALFNHVDQYGNIYTAGKGGGTIDFAPGDSTYNLYVGNSIFIQKLDSNKNLLWVKTFSGGSPNGKCAAVDKDGNVYLTGKVSNSIPFDIDPNPDDTLMVTNTGSNQGFIIKLDSNGNNQWVTSFGKVWKMSGIAVDDANGVYVCGNISDENADFDPGEDTLTLNGEEAFYGRFTSDGDLDWIHGIGDSYYHHIEMNTIATDSSNNVFFAGLFDGYGVSVDFYPGPGGTLTSPSIYSKDIFVLKLDTAGALGWVKKLGTSYSSEECADITVDNNQDIYVVGQYPGSGIVNDKIYIAKVLSNGASSWSKTLAGSNSGARAVTTDEFNNVYVTGYYKGNGYFGPSPNGYISSSDFDMFLVKYSEDGDFRWVTSEEGWSHINAYSLATTPNNSVLACGQYIDSVHTEMANGDTILLTSSGTRDMFHFQYDECIVYGTDNRTTCDTLIWIDGNPYFTQDTTATFTLYASSENGCDSIVSLHLNLEIAPISMDTISICDSLAWIDGNTYFSDTNNVSFVLENSSFIGCDSTVILYLDILDDTEGVDEYFVCDSLQWIDGNTYFTSNNTATHTLTNHLGCDSLVTLQLNIQNNTSTDDHLLVCDSLTWIDGHTYYSDNQTATHTLTNQFGCDSIVSLNLTMVDINLNVSLSGFTLKAISQQGATYQWINCDDNSEISGATQQTFTPSVNGNYAVKITKNNCTKVSDCKEVTGIDISENSIQLFSIFPNPTKSTTTVRFSETKPEVIISIYDMVGKEIQRSKYLNKETILLDLQSLPSGTYTLSIKTNNEISQKKITKL
jgi:hypothetical protein